MLRAVSPDHKGRSAMPLRSRRFSWLWLSAVLPITLLSACTTSQPTPLDLRPELQGSTTPADKDACFATETLPAIYESTTEQVRIAPSRSGAAPIYSSETRQKQVSPSREVRFAVPCPAQKGPEFTASLQRALKARGFYTGPVTGVSDARTEAAVRSYQAQAGLQSAQLSLSAARALGLIAVPL